MTRISSVSTVMEAYYKLTQTPSEMEEELKKELSNQDKQLSGDTSTLDDLTEVVGTIKNEIQFLNKTKNLFNEIYKIVDEAHNYLKNLNHEAITGLSQTNLKNKLDGYISLIRSAVSNDGGTNFSEQLINYVEELTEVNIDDIWKTLSSHEVQVKSRILGGLDSNVSTNEIISGKQINIQNKDNSLSLSQTSNQSANILASSINGSLTLGVYAKAKNNVSFANLSSTGTYSFKITNTKTGSSGHSLSGITISDINNLTPFYDAINNSAGSTGVTAKINEDLSVVTLIDNKGDNINLSNFTTTSGNPTLNIFSEYNRSSRDVRLADITVRFTDDSNIGDDGELRGGYVEFFTYDKLNNESISIKTNTEIKTALNEVSIVGDQIYVGLGDSNSTQIGYVDPTLNGQNGQKIRFKFYDEDQGATQTIFINETILKNLSNLVTFNNVNMNLTNNPDDLERDPRIETVAADINAYIYSTGIAESPVTSTSNAIATANYGLTNTHDVSITGTFQYVGNTSDISRTVTIEENASSKLLAEQLNTISAPTNTSFSATNNVIISHAEALGAVSFKLASHNKTSGIIGTSDISANITETGERIVIQTGGIAGTRTFTIRGTGTDGSALTETISVAPNSSATGNENFSTVYEVMVNSAMGGSGIVNIGTSSNASGIVDSTGGYSEDTLTKLKINGSEASDKNIARLTYHDGSAVRNLTNLKNAINAQQGTTGIQAQDFGDSQALLLTHSTGENIVMSELSGVGLRVQAASFHGNSRVNTARTLDAARNLEIISDKRYVAITPSSSGSITADYTITGTNFAGEIISETISGVNPSGGTKFSTNIYSTVTQVTTSNVTSDVTLVGHVDTDGSSNLVANSVIADDASNTARPLENDGTTKSEISLNGSQVSGTADLLSATDGQFVTVTADAGSPVLTVRINGRNYLGDAHQRDIEIIPGSTVTINSNGDSDRFATVHRMQTLGSMIGERINIQNSGSRQTQFTISGTLHDGDSDTEVITVSAGGTTSGLKFFKTVTDIKANLNPNGNVIIGTVRDQDAIFTSQSPNSSERVSIQNAGTQNTIFTVNGTLENGSTNTETISVSAGATQSGTTNFKTITSISANVDPDGAITVGTSSDPDGIIDTTTPGSSGSISLNGSYVTSGVAVLGTNFSLTLDGADVSSGTATLAEGNIQVGVVGNNNGLAQSQKPSHDSANSINITENGTIDKVSSSGGIFALTEGKLVSINVPTDGIKGIYRVKGMDKYGRNNKEEVINANSHGTAINGSTGFLRISNVYVNSLDPSNIKVGTARDNGDSGTANTIFDDDAITTANVYQAAGNLNINGSSTSGSTAILNDTNLTFNITGTNSEGNNISESISGSASSPSVKTSNQYATVSQISVSNSPTTSVTGNIRIGTNTSTNNVATTQTPNPGGNLTLAGSASSISTDDSILTIGSIQGSSRQKLSSTATNNFYNLNNQSGVLNGTTITTPIPDLTSPGIKITTNSNHEVITTGEIFVHSNKPFIITQQDAADENKIVQIFADAGNNNVAFTIKGRDDLGNLIEESVTSSAGNSVSSSKKFAIVYQITAAGDPGGNIKVGTSIDDDSIATSQNLNVAVSSDLVINGVRKSTENAIVNGSSYNQAVLRKDGSTFFSLDENQNEVNLYDFSLSQTVAGQEFTQRYSHALTDMTNAITIIDNTLLKETQVNSAGENLFAKNSQSGFTKEEFMEMGLKTADRIKNLTSKTLLIKNIHSQRQNLSMLMSGQLYGFALLNFKGNFDLTKK